MPARVHDTPGMAAFSCRSIRVTHNRLSNAEAEMYDADIEYGMKTHPWRKILDHALSHAARSTANARIENPILVTLPECFCCQLFCAWTQDRISADATCITTILGQTCRIARFTRDFVTGEMRYFSTKMHDGRRLAGRAPRMDLPRSWDRSIAKASCESQTRDLLAPFLTHSRSPAYSPGRSRAG